MFAPRSLLRYSEKAISSDKVGNIDARMEIPKESSVDFEDITIEDDAQEDINDAMSLEPKSDLELSKHTLMDPEAEASNEDFRSERVSDRSQIDQDLEVDGHKAISVGDHMPRKTSEAALLIFELHNDVGKVLQRVPYQVQKTAAFVISLAALKSDTDILADSNGRWTLMRGKREGNYMFDNSKEMFSTVEGEGNKFVRTCYTNGSNPDFKRVVIMCKSIRLVFLQYYFKEGPERTFQVAPHGNSTKNIPHERLRDSTRRRIEDLLSREKSREKFTSKLPKNSEIRHRWKLQRQSRL